MCSIRCGFLSAVIFAGFVVLSNADVLLPDHHPVERCITIQNLDEFPDISLIGQYTGPMTAEPVRYIIQADSCLYKGYKFNRLSIYWVLNDYLEAVGLENMPLSQPATAKKKEDVLQQCGFITDELDPYGGQVPDDNPLIKEELFFRISSNAGSFRLLLAERISSFRDGTENNEVFISTSAYVSKFSRAPSELEVNATLGKGLLVFSPLFEGHVEGALINCNGKLVTKFTRKCQTGVTYVIPCSGLSAGMYWLLMRHGNSTANIQLNQF